MRDIHNYEIEYNKEFCEIIQVEYRRKKIIEELNKYNHKRILEIGCGNSPIFDFFFDFESMTVVEPGNGFAQNAREKALLYPDKNITIVQGLIENVKEILKEQEYDYIILSALIHEVSNAREILDDVYELCSDDTVLHINVPNARSIHRLLAVEMGIIEDIHEVSDLGKKLQQNSVYDIDGMRGLLSDCGFEVLESGSFFPKFLSYSQLEKMLRGQIIDERFFAGMYALGKYFPDYGSEIYLQVKKG